MICTAALTQTLWPQLVARLTFLCVDPIYLLLRCGSGATSGAVAYVYFYHRQSVRTAAKYVVDDKTNVMSRLNAAQFRARLVTDCKR